MVLAFFVTMLLHWLVTDTFMVITNATVALPIVAAVVPVVLLGLAFVSSRRATPSRLALLIIITTLTV